MSYYIKKSIFILLVIVLVISCIPMEQLDAKEKDVKQFNEFVQGGTCPEYEIKTMDNDMYNMSLKELNENGYIEQICEETGMNKTWFDNISTTESTYGKFTPDGLYNAWGWGIYGDNKKCMGDNWYDASKRFAEEFVDSYGTNPTREDMRRYCPVGAYDKYF